MTFVDQLRPELIRVAAPWRTFAETVGGLTTMLVAARVVPESREADAIRAVTTREAAASTAILDIGVGVPHARLDGLEQPAVALALSPIGLYEAVPTVPIQIAALVLSPPTGIADHLHLLASIATLLRSPELRSALLRAGDQVGALALLAQHARGGP
jgi:mannitol/fructose-specific phosphotransferase system IIA component (Ntr-type)